MMHFRHLRRGHTPTHTAYFNGAEAAKEVDIESYFYLQLYHTLLYYNITGDAIGTLIT